MLRPRMAVRLRGSERWLDSHSSAPFSNTLAFVAVYPAMTDDTSGVSLARQRAASWTDSVSQDLRYAIRGLRRSPAFTATAILTLGLGIGANTAMFGIIDRLMFRPFPYLRDPGRVHRVYLQWNDRQDRKSV